MRCYAVVAPGLEALTAQELIGHGIRPGATEPGGVEFSATPAQLYTANLHLRTASRILVRIASFRATAFWELEKQGKRVPWNAVVAPGATVAFRVTSRKSKLYHQHGIAERLGEAAAGAVPGISASAADAGQEFVVRVYRDEVSISADSSGEPLHRRGYRLATAKAPLRETLAAAMLLGASWDPTTPMLDPFCGSGTIPIEAALLARRIPPGWGRSFACERWPSFEAHLTRPARDAAAAEILPRVPAPILGSDRDAGAVEAARANAERAGVGQDISFACLPLSRVNPGEQPGWVVTNPPYGVRVGQADRLRDLYARLGTLAEHRLAGWRFALLSADPGLVRYSRLGLTTAWRARNGGIPVRLELGQGVSR